MTATFFHCFGKIWSPGSPLLIGTRHSQSTRIVCPLGTISQRAHYALTPPCDPSPWPISATGGNTPNPTHTPIYRPPLPRHSILFLRFPSPGQDQRPMPIITLQGVARGGKKTRTWLFDSYALLWGAPWKHGWIVHCEGTTPLWVLAITAQEDG